jgi:hypothetical protein
MLIDTIRFREMLRLESEWKTVLVDTHGTATIQCRAKRVLYEMDTGQDVFRYDSAKAADLPGAVGKTMTPVLQALTEHLVSFGMSQNGQIQKLSFPKELEARISTHAKNPEWVGEVCDKSTLSTLLCAGFPVVPGKPVAAGSEWSSSYRLPCEGGNLVITRKLKYEGREESKDKIGRAKGEVKVTEQPDKGRVATASIIPESGESVFMFDIETGEVAELKDQIRMRQRVKDATTEYYSERSIKVECRRKERAAK